MMVFNQNGQYETLGRGSCPILLRQRLAGGATKMFYRSALAEIQFGTEALSLGSYHRLTEKR